MCLGEIRNDFNIPGTMTVETATEINIIMIVKLKEEKKNNRNEKNERKEIIFLNTNKLTKKSRKIYSNRFTAKTRYL